MIQKVAVKSWKSYEQHTPKGNEKMKKQEQQKKGCRERSLASISRRVSSGAMLVALAMIFSYVESLIPINLGIQHRAFRCSGGFVGAEGCISTGQRFVFIRGIIKIKYWHCNFSFITVPFLTLITGTVLLFFRFPFLCR